MTLRKLWRKNWPPFAPPGGNTMELTDATFEAANRRAAERQKHGPVAVDAHYDPMSGRVMVELATGLLIAFKPEHAQGLEQATEAQLQRIEISPSGQGLHFPALDADLFLPGLLEGHMGSKAWMAARLGKSGGQSTSAAKQAAVRANGAKGGRPRKRPAEAS
jgi:hypothetical protein